MSADGIIRTSAPVLADGVYLDLPLADYLADPALSGSAFKKLLSDPASVTWERPDNPLWEDRPSRPRTRGSAAHCAILEGLDAYTERYAVQPEPPAGALVTCDDLQEWLRQFSACDMLSLAEYKFRSDLEPHLTKQGKLRLTGSREELIARVGLLDPSAPIWDGGVEDLAGRTALAREDDAYVRMLERFVRRDPVFAPLVSGGMAEVSIFWSEDGLRFKARVDYLTAHTLLDLKTFGQPPRRGRSLREHCVNEAAYNGYDLQAVHNFRAVEWAAHAATVDALTICGPSPSKASECNAFLQELHAGDPVFRWLFLRMGGAPTGLSIPFRESDGQWHEARRQIEDACAIYRQFCAAFGEDLWLATHGEQEIEDQDWPLAAIRTAA